MKLVTAFIVVVLAALGGAFVLKRLGQGGELPIEGMDSVQLAPVPPIQEAP